MPRPYFHNKIKHIDEILRVDHAGEYGAIRIYEGQLASLGGAIGNKATHGLARHPNRHLAMTAISDIIHHMLAQEQKHLEYFEDEIIINGTRPTLLLPIWNILGFAMGYISSLAGVKIVMLTTEAVEEVIDEHYKAQYDLALSMNNPELANKIEEHRQDELEHKNTAIEYGSHDAIFFPYIKMAIGKLCKFAIFASKII
jgi:ubiquinone biosynthesis monooxygenase Coq7